MLTADEIARLIARFYEAELSQDSEDRLQAIESWQAKIHQDRHARLLAELREHLGRGEFVLIKWAADWIIEQEGFPIERNGHEYKRLCHYLQRTWIEVVQRWIERDNGDFTGIPSDPMLKRLVVEQVPSGVATQRGAPTLNPLGNQPMTVLVERLLNEKRDARPKTIDKYRAVAKLFDEFSAKKAASLVTRQDIVDFKDALTQLPVNWSKRFPGMSPAEAIAENQKRKSPTLAPRNIKDSYLVYVNTFFKWALSNNIRTDNPAVGVTVMTPKGFNKKQSRDPFAVCHLQAIFDAPIFRGCLGPDRPYSPGSFLIRDHRFWVPLVALYSGARLNELGQLEVRDVQEIGGIPCFRITTQSDLHSGENIKILKTKSSARTIPLHPMLKALGFLEYVAARRAAGDFRVFPNWHKGKDGTYSSVFSKSFNGQFLPKVGIKTPKLVFHSFRHTFIDAMREAGIEDGVQKAIVGHSDQSTTAIYGAGQPILRLAGAIDKICYAGLTLTNLLPTGVESRSPKVAA